MHAISFYTYLLLSLFVVIPLIVAVGLAAVHDLFGNTTLTTLVIGSGVCAVLVQVLIRWNAFQQLQMRDVRWYAAQYPSHVQGRRVRCATCRSEDTRIRRMADPTRMREHYCGACGQVLYYSPDPG